MSKRGRGRVALPPGDKRRVKVSPHFTEGEAARLDAVRGGVERAEWLRAVAMREVGRRERAAGKAAKTKAGSMVKAWAEFPSGLFRDFARGDIAAFVNGQGWGTFSLKGRLASGPETGPEGQRLADAALRDAGYVLADGGEA